MREKVESGVEALKVPTLMKQAPEGGDACTQYGLLTFIVSAEGSARTDSPASAATKPIPSKVYKKRKICIGNRPDQGANAGQVTLAMSVLIGFRPESSGWIDTENTLPYKVPAPPALGSPQGTLNPSGAIL